MKTPLPFSLAFALLLLFTGATQANGLDTLRGPGGVPLDTIQERAFELLKANLAYLQDPYGHGEFDKMFAPGAQYYCDICMNAKNEDIANYLSFYPRDLTFTYEVHTERIVAEQTELGVFELEVPFRKRVPNVTASGISKTGSKWVDLVAYMLFDYNTGSYKFTNVLQDRAPGADVLMLEVSPLYGLGSMKFEAVEGSAPTSSTWAATAGLAYYFNPFGGTNRANMWLKVGLRGGLRRTTLRSNDGFSFEQEDVVLTTTGANPAYPLGENIDVTQHVSGIEEKISSVVLEVPIGLSKRWDLTREIDFALEVEAGYGYEVSRSVKGGYTLEQTGTDHRIFIGDDAIGVVMLQGDGTTDPRFYDRPAEAVMSTDGQINFFTEQGGSLDDLSKKGKGYLLFGLNPSLFIRKGGNDRIRYNIGLRVAMLGTHAGSGEELTGTYFLQGLNEQGLYTAQSTERAGLSTYATSKYQTYIGLFVGINLK